MTAPPRAPSCHPWLEPAALVRAQRAVVLAGCRARSQCVVPSPPAAPSTSQRPLPSRQPPSHARPASVHGWLLVVPGGAAAAWLVRAAAGTSSSSAARGRRQLSKTLAPWLGGARAGGRAWGLAALLLLLPAWAGQARLPACSRGSQAPSGRASGHAASLRPVAFSLPTPRSCSLGVVALRAGGVTSSLLLARFAR